MSEQAKAFFDLLVHLGAIYPGEAEILARVHRDPIGRPNLSAVVDVAATRMAHKRDYPANKGDNRND